jgi:hypothetical protein
MEEVEGIGASAPSALDWLLELLDLLGSAPYGHASRRQCPAHDDATPSFSISFGRDGKVLLRCHRGCSVEGVLDALAITMVHLHRRSALTPQQHIQACWPPASFPALERHTGARGSGRRRAARVRAIHSYGRWRLVRYRHKTTGEKNLHLEHLKEGVVWLPGLGGAALRDLPLYEEKQVVMAVATGEPVIVVESESSADAFMAVGLYATTWAGGADNPAGGADNPNLIRLASVLSRAGA